MNYGFVIDNRKCIGCHACTVACKSEHDVPLGVNRTHVKYIEKGIFPNSIRKFSVHRCNHCEDAPCTTICPTSALFTRADGIVDFDGDRCIGCKSCMQACPYDALYIDPQTHTAAKCNYCAHRVDAGYQPACVVVCPVGAIVSGDLADPKTEIAELVAKQPVTVRKPEKGTKPNLYYVDGDDFMLNPHGTSRPKQYLWSEQQTGVGHFAGSSLGCNDAAGISKGNSAAAERVYDSPAKGVLWGWEVPAYLCTKALAVGTFMMAYAFQGMGGRFGEGVERNLLLSCLFFLTLTAVLLIKDLDRPDRFLYVLLRPNWNSWLVRGAYIISAFGLITTLLLVGQLCRLRLDWLIIPGMICALLGAIYTAFLLAQAKARDFWQSPMTSVHMLVSALISGGVVLLFLAPAAAQTATQALQILLPVSLGLTILELVTPHVSEDAKQVVALMTTRPYATILFWGLLLGNLLPVFFFWNNLLTLPAGVLALAGLAVTEYLRVKLPQLIPLS